MKQDAPIGIFDSGIGGLTVVRELRRVLPREDIIYVGDTARVPYGSRDPVEIRAFMRQFLRFFAGRGAKSVVFACNTMTACGFSEARAEAPFLVTAMNSGVGEAIRASRQKKIGVIATKGTVENGMHRHSARSLRAEVEIYAKACPDFVPLIESGVVAGEQIESAAERYLRFFAGSGIDALILGCTHYPLIGDVLRKYLGPDVRLINPARATAIDAVNALKGANGLRAGHGEGKLRLCFSADLDKARVMSELVLETNQAAFERIDLANY